jgi:hypothetical protein
MDRFGLAIYVLYLHLQEPIKLHLDVRYVAKITLTIQGCSSPQRRSASFLNMSIASKPLSLLEFDLPRHLTLLIAYFLNVPFCMARYTSPKDLKKK